MSGGPLHIDERGSGPAVVLFHGTPSSPADFTLLVERLARQHRVLVPHFPGYGRSPADPGPRSNSVESASALLERQLLGAGVSSADFVAFSGGAYKAVHIALACRIHVLRLVLFAPIVGLDPETALGFRELVSATRSGAFDPRLSWTARMCSAAFVERDPQGAARVLDWLAAAPLSVVCDELEAMADAVDLRPLLGRLTCRVLVCTGTADNAVPPAWSEAVARRIPGAVFHAIEPAGHAVLLEEPERTVRLVETFLGSGDV